MVNSFIGSNGTAATSVTKTLTRLVSLPSNRSCADCRAALVDTSQVHASFTPEHVSHENEPKPDLDAFRKNHATLAPNGVPEPLPVDPAHMISELCAHGVFVCSMCAAAHKQLGSDVLVVKAVHATASWTNEEVAWFSKIGGNSKANHTLEHYMQQRAISTASTLADRVHFGRAKYQALCYCLPPSNGPLAEHAWGRIVDLHPEWEGLWDVDLSNTHGFTPGSNAELVPALQQLRSSNLPNRLVDYFCVASPTNHLDPSVKDLSSITSPNEIQLLPRVTDCYPSPGSYGDDFPEHVSAFCYPDGCHASTMAQPPAFFSFVFTNSYGERLYGGALRIYDDNREIVSTFSEILKNSKLPEEKYPPWLRERPESAADEEKPLPTSGPEESSFGTEIMFLPKCLILMSHYPFFDLWRKFLMQIYRIALTEAPIPIERFIANFVSEIPLPPPGRIQVEFGFTHQDTWVVQRPPDNKLPLVNLSYKPLFTCLSVSNVMVVMGCLMQETKVALLSKHYSLLCPVSEALISLLFPLHWQGMYIPILPYRMLDILDAPVPYLVGLHARYLKEVPLSRRPGDVVFVDLDRDAIHLGFADLDCTQPRPVPPLPSSKASKLKSKLMDCAANVYVKPETSKVGTLTTGVGREFFDDEREGYVEIHNSECQNRPYGRRDVLPENDKAYSDNELLNPIVGFQVESGKFHQISPKESSSPRKKKNMFRKLKGKNHGSPKADNGDNSTGSTGETNIFDLHEPRGFSTSSIRDAFLHFFLSLLKSYRSYSDEEEFQAQEFVSSLGLPDDEGQFVLDLISTQMFEGFLADRRECPDDSEILFFDESIDAKYNKSKKAMLTGGKIETPFLSNSQHSSSDETYIPPPPSNWGLPDDERTYHYGTFPTLDRSLFGKVRKPKQLVDEQMRRLDRRRMTSAARENEQLLQKKAAGSLFIRTKKHATLKNLSAPFSRWAGSDSGKSDDGSDKSSNDLSLPSTSPHSPESRTSKEKVILNTRRRQAILIGAVVKLQSCCRMYLVRRRRYGKLCSTGARSKFTLKDRAAMAMQSCVRGQRDRTAFHLLRSSITHIQAAVRGFFVRNAFRSVIAKRFLVYRNVIFQLWEKCSVSLCYRSAFWDHLKEHSLVRLAVAEAELHRLWAEVGWNGNSPMNDAGGRDSKFPIRSKTFKDCVQIQEILRGPNAGLLKPKNETFSREANDRIQAERAQLYEKFSKVDSSLDGCLHLFSISAKEKKKKSLVAIAIWSKLSTADASSSLMIEQFPELRESNNIHYRALSSKALRRFNVTNSFPPPLKQLASSKLEDCIRRNVLEVAITGISLVVPNGEPDDALRRRIHALMEVRGLHNLPEAKGIIMKEYLHKRSLVPLPEKANKVALESAKI